MKLHQKLKIFSLFILIIAWLFGSYPAIWQNPRISLEIQEARAYATLTYVGGAEASGNSANYNVSLTGLTGGIGSAAQTGDLVIVATGWGSTADGNPGVATAGYTEVADLYRSDTYDANFSVNWKIMGGTPDTSVTCNGSGGATLGAVCVVHVWRNANQTTPLDVTSTTATAGNAAVPNSPAITPVTTGAIVIATGLGAMAAVDASVTAPTGYGNKVDISVDPGTAATVGISSKPWSGSGAEDPAAWTNWTTTTADSWAAVTLAIRPAPSAPTVTTQAASSMEDTTATCNGNITNTGGANATSRGCEWDTDSGAPYANNASDSGSFGTGAFTKGLTGLPAGTTIYARAFATNSAGTGYGSEVSFLTKPAAPTGVSATDGTYTDKVTITWTKSTGATGYRVYRDGSDASGLLGDVATYDDIGADASTITPGSTVASDGTSNDYVSLSLSSTSANNGTTHTYKVVASNATGNSADSTTDTGYRNVGSLTYQWQRSAADSDANYSDISGATTASYDDTGAPADGSGRYYKCVLNATGATQQTSASDRGYRQVAAVVSVSISDGIITYGSMPANTSKSTLPGELNDAQTATNDGNIAENFNIRGQDTACPWTLSATAGSEQYVHQFCNDTDLDCSSPPTNYTALTTSYQALDTNIAVSGTIQFQLRLTTPTNTACFSQQSVDVTIQAVQP